jgi:hypothetical protein
MKTIQNDIIILMKPEPRSLILLAIGLVLAGILLVWSGLAWASSHPLGVWGLFGLFFGGAGMCLAGGILSLWLFLGALPALSSDHLRLVNAPLLTAAWIMALAVILPVMVMLLPVLVQAWLGQQQVELSAAAMVKSWPVSGAPLQTVLLLGLVCLLIWRRRPLSGAEASQGFPQAAPASPVSRRKRAWPLVFSLLSGVGLWLAAIFIQRITLALAPPSWANWFSPISANFKPAGPAGSYSMDHWPVVLTMVILAPLAEEAFFRGFVYPAWRQRAGRSGELWGLLGSSALWAAYALNPLTFPSLVVAGLGLGLVARQTMRLDLVNGSPTLRGHAALQTGAVNLLPVWLAHVMMSLLFVFM